MEEDIYQLLLNGMPFQKFIVYYAMGFAGAIMFFLGNLYNAIQTDTNTPAHWSWRHFAKGAIRVVLSLVSLAFAIIYFKEMTPFIFNLGEGSNVDINGFSALLLGIGIDRLWKALLAVGVKGKQIIYKK